MRVLTKEEKEVYEDLMKGILIPIKVKFLKPPKDFEVINIAKEIKSDQK